jgi:hypothetical protein
MKKQIIKFFGLFIILLTFSTTGFGQVHVKGYTKSNGTYVEPHTRSSPNSSPYDNYSYPGNTNPYTGKIATGNPDTYIKNNSKNSEPSTSDIWVEGYYKSDGTYVTGYYSSKPNYNSSSLYNQESSNSEIFHRQISLIVDAISISLDNKDMSIYTHTRTDGSVAIHIESIKFNGLVNDEYSAGLDISKLFFELFFYYINHGKEIPVSAYTVAQAMENKHIVGIEFKTKSRLHSYTWKQILEKQ